MNDLLNFAFENELVRVVTKDEEPWFVGIDACRALEISDHKQALARLDDDERGWYTIPSPGGSQKAIIISLPGLARLLTTSRAALAKQFQRWLFHEVLPAIFKTGKYVTQGAENAPPEEGLLADLTQWRAWALNDPRGALEKVRTAHRLYGKARARLVWDQLGLLKVPELTAPSPLADGFACLAHLLAWTISPPGIGVRDAIELAIDGDKAHGLFLKGNGIRAQWRPDGFVVANSHPQIQEIFLDTEWSKGYWYHALRNLPGAHPTEGMRFGKGNPSRGTFVPVRYLDDRFPRRQLA